MPPKRASSKKASTKAAALAADAKEANNGEKELIGEFASDAKSVANGSTPLNGTEDAVKEPSKAKSTRRGGGGGRTKDVAAELETEAPATKKPAAKGRGRKKAIENEVIENETDEAQPEVQVEEENEQEEEEALVKPKGRGGGKKAEPKAKKAAVRAKGDEKKAFNAEAEEAKVLEMKTKTRGSRGKIQEESVELKPEVVEEVVEKATKKSSRSTKKAEENTAAAEVPKKRGRAAKKDIPSETDLTEVKIEAEPLDESEEKRPTKRGRGAAKAVAAAATNEEISGIEIEEVLPKKRSRKAASVEKEITANEKPRKGRAKKTNKSAEKEPEPSEHLQEGKEPEEEVATANGQMEKTEEMEASSSLNKKPEIVAATAATAAEAPVPTATKAKGGRKRAAPSTNNKKTAKTPADEVPNMDDGVDNNTELEDEADGSKPSKSKKGKSDTTAPLNATNTKYNKADFELPPPAEGEIYEEPRFNLKIASWNVAGLRSWLKKEGLKFLDYEQPDIFCMQETKCTTDQLPEEVARIPGYHPYWLCMPGGYAGVAIYSKIMPINVEYGIGHKEFDDNGRIITAEYEKFFLVNVYVPNSGRKLVNLEPRMKWEKLFQEFIQNLDSRKPVVICGDMNVSHQEHDLANPKTNTRNAGFTKEERDKMTELLSLGYIDTFRHLYPQRKGAYTFWTYMGNARSRNVGWRLDYFIVSERFIQRVVDNCIRSQCMGSDHCPITLFMKL